VILVIILVLLLCALTKTIPNTYVSYLGNTIYIRADGAVEPSTAPISSADNITYVLTSNIFEPIIMERDNITLDGQGHTIQGAGSGNGINLASRINVTMENMNVENFTYGIYIYLSSNITIFNNTITDNIWDGIYAVYTDTSIIYGNTISSNMRYGITLSMSGNNQIFHNNFIDNANQTHLYESFNNAWDNYYPSGGNYWSNYTGNDSFNGLLQNLTSGDGIGDVTYVLDAYNQDTYPLIAPISLYDAGRWDEEHYQIEIVSNSTLLYIWLNITQRIFSFNVASEAGSGFCRIAMPNVIIQEMWQGNYTVLVDGEQSSIVRSWTDKAYIYIYFTYPYSTHEVIIIPELSSTMIKCVFTVLSFVAIVIVKRKPITIKNDSS
jgi:parallel beta-helix repeat protein